MIHFLVDLVGVTVGIGLYNWIKWLIKRDINQSQVGGSEGHQTWMETTTIKKSGE